MPIPHQIEAAWDPRYAYLAGFPLNLMYCGPRAGQVAHCIYWFDPGSYRENARRREMWYRPRHPSRFRVRVRFDKRTLRWQTSKFRGREELSYAEGTEFDKAMMHTTLVGLQPDEPVDPEEPAPVARGRVGKRQGVFRAGGGRTRKGKGRGKDEGGA
jgi:hypothetical protein